MRLPTGTGADAWEVLADGTRRQLVDLLLASGEASATELTSGVSISRQGVLKHLAVLERVGLLRRRTVGREVRFRVDDERLAQAARDMAAAARDWDRRLRLIKDLAEDVERARADHL